MPDKEKVVIALRTCAEMHGTKSCRKCPYFCGRNGNGTIYPLDAEKEGIGLCFRELIEDAITLLKGKDDNI